jgi:hypothetical protein
MTETWKECFSGSYEVSSMGNVRRAKPGRGTYAGRPIKPILMKIGYLEFRPVVNGKNVAQYLHSLVAELFIGPRPDGAEVNHIDGDKTNNRVTNLEYVTHAENMAHASSSGLMQKGESHHASVLTEGDVREIRRMRESGSGLIEICQRFSVAKPTISQICNMRRWKHI